MLKLLLIKKNSDFFEFLAKEHELQNAIIISPNPQGADLARSRLESKSEIESITISKFIQEELNFLCEDLLENFKGKSELLLLLGAIWRKLGKTEYSSFKRAFNLLTEFRSFSMSDHVLETVLEHYDEETSDAVIWLHRFLNQMDIVDEHRSYFQLSERLRQGDLPPDYKTERKLVFFGFDFMTGSQVDMLKSMAIRDDIILPFYIDAYEKSQSLDWIKWLIDSNSEILDISSSNELNTSMEYIGFSKNYLGKTLKNIPEMEGLDIVLGVKKLTEEVFMEIPYAESKVKILSTMFQGEFKDIFISLKKEMIFPIDSAELREQLRSLLVSRAEKEEYIYVKCLFVIINKINEWESLASENNLIGEFALAVIEESAALDLPRVNLASLREKTEIPHIYSLKDLPLIKDTKVLWAINSNHGNIKTSGAVYSDQVEKYLVSIGPIKRSELELDILHAKMNEFVADNDVTLLLENGIIEHDLVWSAILKDYNLTEKADQVSLRSKKVDYVQIDTRAADLSRLSATRLQKYIECPRQFFHRYVDNMFPMVRNSAELDAIDLGNLEHKIIEIYLKKHSSFNQVTHIKLVEENLSEYCAEKEITIAQREEYTIELLAYTEPAIKALYTLEISYQLKFNFELPFKTKGTLLESVGSVDCFGENNELGYKFILDFKRSGRTFTSYKSILEFEQIQLWFYLNNLERLGHIKNTDKVIFGYMNLSDISTSRFFTNNKDLMKEFKKETGFKLVKSIDDFEDTFNEYKMFEESKTKSLIEDDQFLACPQSPDCCTYCSISNLCDRGGL